MQKNRNVNIPQSTFIAPGAVVLGNVTVGELVGIWYQATVRGDRAPISIGMGSNIQDNAVVHVEAEYPVKIGENVTIGHGAIIHGCEIGDNSLIGMGAIIMNGAVIGKNCIVGAGALVTQNTKVPDGTLMLGNPAKAKREVTEEEIAANLRNAILYQEEAREALGKAIDLFLFMGQSNMAGRGIACEKWPETAPELISGAGYEYRAVSAPGKLFPIEEPFGAAENRDGGINDGTMKTGSMVTAFVNAYYEQTQVPIVGVSASKGGSSILQWQPGTPFLEDTRARLEDAREYLIKQGYTIRHTYMLWTQGETDGDHHMSGTDYQMYFGRMWQEMRSLGVEKCFLIRTGHFNGTGETSYGEIRQAQDILVREQPDVIMVSALFATMKERGLMKDAFHYYQQAYNEVGTDAGRNVADYVNRYA